MGLSELLFYAQIVSTEAQTPARGAIVTWREGGLSNLFCLRCAAIIISIQRIGADSSHMQRRPANAPTCGTTCYSRTNILSARMLRTLVC